ncbi:hypothetical protein [Thermoanaerobacterium thermosulfurigenes]|uniref:hypothetical protein n=1 Tax=Thermoanaerobacterium thermosulfurigenes TaxID=33950 RepID=UPI003EF515FA
MTEEIEKKIVNYVKDGGSLFAWHSGLSSYSEDGLLNESFLKTLHECINWCIK